MKRIFIIHGWGGTPDSNWIPWLKYELIKKGFDVHTPFMPSTDNPQIKEWVEHLANEVCRADNDTYLIGHSMGCQTILRYLEGLPDDVKVGGVLFVAGFITINKEIMAGDGAEILRPWVESKINLTNVQKHSDKFVSLFSDDDPYVPLEDAKAFELQLSSKIIIVPKAGHFTIELGGYGELHLALNEILKMVK